MYVLSLKYGDLFTFTAKFDMLVASVIKVMYSSRREKKIQIVYYLFYLTQYHIASCTVLLQQTTLISDDRRNSFKFYLRFYFIFSKIAISRHDLNSLDLWEHEKCENIAEFSNATSKNVMALLCQIKPNEKWDSLSVIILVSML
jgi:hypothetical protein